MQVTLDVWQPEEMQAVAELFSKLATIAKVRGAQEVKDVVEETEPVATEAPAKRRGRKPKEETAPEPVVVETAPEPVVVEPEPVKAAPVSKFEKKDLEDSTRALAKKNYPAVKALLEKFGVARFGELPEAKYQEYGTALAAL